jgi:hypothetical protein
MNQTGMQLGPYILYSNWNKTHKLNQHYNTYFLNKMLTTGHQTIQRLDNKPLMVSVLAVFLQSKTWLKRILDKPETWTNGK